MNAQPDMKPAVTDPAISSRAPEQPGDAQFMLDPFSDAQVEGLFFPGAGRQDTLEQLQHLLRYGPALLVLDGDEGVGKQFLMNRLLAMLDPELFELALIQANVLNSPDAISSALSAAWNCSQDLTLQNRQQVLTATAQAADNESKTLLAIVRQAQHLSPESCLFMRELLAITAGLPVKFLLVVDAVELESVGYLYELISQVPDNFQLTLYPLSLEETKEYLAYRLRTAGLGQVRFNDDQVKSIFNHSLGNIQQINDMARDLLKTNLPSPQPKKPPSNLPKMHLIALAVMVLVLSALVLLRSGGETEPETVAQINGVKTTSVESAAAPQLQKAEVENDVVTELAAQGGDAIQPQSPETGGNEKATTENTAALAEEAQQGVVEDEGGATGAPDKVDENTTAEQIEIPPSEPAPPAEKPEPKSTSEKTVMGVGERTNWVLSLPKSDYVLQLLGAREWNTVETFIKRYKDVNNLAYYKMMRQGVPWYVVLQGSFPDHDAASAAVKKLPDSLQKQGPWIRKVEVIQGELKN